MAPAPAFLSTEHDPSAFGIELLEPLWPLYGNNPELHARERVSRREGFSLFTLRFRVTNPGVSVAALVAAIRARAGIRLASAVPFEDVIEQAFLEGKCLLPTGEYEAAFCRAADDQAFRPLDMAHALDRAGYPGSIAALLALAAIEEQESLFYPGITFATFDDVRTHPGPRDTSVKEGYMPGHSYASRPGLYYRRTMEYLLVDRAYLGRDLVMVGARPVAPRPSAA